MKELITTLLSPSTPLPGDTEAHLAAVHNWKAFCSLVQRTGCAPLIHERVCTYAHTVPQDVLDWLHGYRDSTAAANSRLLDELWTVTGLLDARRIPALVLKGPALACWGTGLQVRMFHDLDLLVRPWDLARTAEGLRSVGFSELQSGHHDFHRVFARTSAHSSTIVEVHFGMFDRERRYTPDLEAIWSRATTIDVLGRTMHTASITDHLLLTIMQLPQHHWTLRLLVDIGHLAVRRTQAIDWEGFMNMARGWGMRVLAGSTLHAAASFWRFALPPEVARFAEPGNYIQRVQWQLVGEALSEQLGLGTPTLGHAAQFLILDRPSAALAAAIRRPFTRRFRDGPESLPHVVRRMGIGVASVPALFAILSGTALTRHQEVSLRGREKSVE